VRRHRNLGRCLAVEKAPGHNQIRVVLELFLALDVIVAAWYLRDIALAR
jgi:hypothetical protein